MSFTTTVLPTLKRMTEVDIKQGLKIVLNKIEVACSERNPVSFYFIPTYKI